MNKNTDNWPKYYEKTISRAHNPRTEKAIQLIESPLKVAIDCGCGTGSDINFLHKNDFTVFGFDANSKSIEICNERFASNANIFLSEKSFESYEFPQAGVIVANKSLFFANPAEFDNTMQKIKSAITIGGVFAGDFLGPKDSWATGFSSPTSPVTKEKLHTLFSTFEIIDLDETDKIGTSVTGGEKHWHIYSLLAIKRS